MRQASNQTMGTLHRRCFLETGVAGLATLAVGGLGPAVSGQTSTAPQPAPVPHREPTRFQVACMTLPYAPFALQRALTGIRGAGFRFVAWGTSHMENGRRVPVMAADAPPERARELAARCRDLGLEPVLMFSEVYPEAANALEVLRSRIRQAAAAGIGQVLTFGHTRGGNERLWVERFRQLAPLAHDNGVMIVIKQHGGETGTGAACARIVRAINHNSIKVNYDAGNVMDYLRLEPARVLADFNTCALEVRSFCIKDHRDYPPPHQDCGPGLGEIDHYRLLRPVAFTGLTIPLCCENIFAPRLPRPARPEGVDALARRAREFLELVIAGVQA
jgi:sugar phosphate isomerase/epimerase